MTFIIYLLFTVAIAGGLYDSPEQELPERTIVHELFRLRNEHKADSAAHYFADTVRVYMKYLRNVPKRVVTQSDKNFWKAYPNNKFEITAPVQIVQKAGITTAIITGKEYLDGTSFQYERIEIKFDRNKKIYSFRGFTLKQQ
ncbi:MAG: hypothetical protein ABL876_05995 [Chitinophagaceae bacterium]